MAQGVFLPLFWHLSWLCKKKRKVLRQAAVPGGEGGTGELGSLAVFGVCSHKSSPAPSECNCGDKVGAA